MPAAPAAASAIRASPAGYGEFWRGRCLDAVARDALGLSPAPAATVEFRRPMMDRLVNRRNSLAGAMASPRTRRRQAGSCSDAV